MYIDNRFSAASSTEDNYTASQSRRDSSHNSDIVPMEIIDMAKGIVHTIGRGGQKHNEPSFLGSRPDYAGQGATRRSMDHNNLKHFVRDVDVNGGKGGKNFGGGGAGAAGGLAGAEAHQGDDVMDYNVENVVEIQEPGWEQEQEQGQGHGQGAQADTEKKSVVGTEKGGLRRVGSQKQVFFAEGT